MPPPTPERVAVSIEQLRIDARRWREASATMDTAHNAAKSLSLSSFEFSEPADWAGLVDVYTELQHKLATVLQQGSTALAKLADTLGTAADSYEADERNAVHRMNNTW